MPTVSVIVPVYNVDPYLQQCLNSLVKQTLHDIEVICVNDGSTDSSGNILDAYAQKYHFVRVISQPNKGPSAARNFGINSAKGAYIGFVDADDWVSRDMYYKLYMSAVNSKSEIAINNIICYSDKRKKYYKDNNYYRSNLPIRYGEKYSLEDIGCSMYSTAISPCNKIFSRNLFDSYKLRFEEGYKYEDVLFQLDAFLGADSMINIEDRGYVYRTGREGSTMNAKNIIHFDIFHISKKVLSSVNENERARNLQNCTFNYIYQNQYKLLKHVVGDEQQQYFIKLLRFWKNVGIYNGEYGVEGILEKIYHLEELGYYGWKRRDRIREIGHLVLTSLNIDSTVKNIRHHFKN